MLPFVQVNLLLSGLGADRIMLCVFFTSSTWWEILSMSPLTSSTYRSSIDEVRHSPSFLVHHCLFWFHIGRHPPSWRSSPWSHPCSPLGWQHLPPFECYSKNNGDSFRVIKCINSVLNQVEELTAASSASRSLITATRASSFGLL